MIHDDEYTPFAFDIVESSMRMYGSIDKACEKSFVIRHLTHLFDCGSSHDKKTTTYKGKLTHTE